MGFVQGAASGQIGGVSANPTLAFTTQNTAAGNLLIAIISLFGATLNSVTDSQGNTYTVSSDFTDTQYHFYLAYALNTLGGTTPTVTYHCSGTPANACAAVGEYSGVNTFRTISVNANGNSTTLASANISAVTGDLLIGFGQAGTNTGITAGAPYNLREQGSISINHQNAFEDTIAASTGAVNATFTVVSAVIWSAGIASFFQASGGGGGGRAVTFLTQIPTLINSLGVL
jgi:hypothetical protein